MTKEEERKREQAAKLAAEINKRNSPPTPAPRTKPTEQTEPTKPIPAPRKRKAGLTRQKPMPHVRTPEGLQELAQLIQQSSENLQTKELYQKFTQKVDAVKGSFEKTDIGLDDDAQLFVQSKLDAYKIEAQSIFTSQEPDINKLQEMTNNFIKEITNKLKELAPEEPSNAKGFFTAFNKNQVKERGEEPKPENNKPKL